MTSGNFNIKYHYHLVEVEKHNKHCGNCCHFDRNFIIPIRRSVPKAFSIFDEVTGKIFPGMTLRDYFAGQALAGLVVNYVNIPNVVEIDVARESYVFADAMLAEREKTNGKDNG